MATRNDYMSSSFIFELTIHKICLAVSRAIDVDLLWVAGTQRSQTGECISILPNTTTHKVDQKLLIHHSFKDERISSFKSIIKVVESQRYVRSTVLGTCDIDLASLIFEKNTHAITVPLDTQLDRGASMNFSVKITNLVMGDGSIVSSSTSSVSEQLAEYQEFIAVSSIGNSTKTHVLNDMNSEDIYRTINKMATKLSHIEGEIQSKTMKLNKINRNNLDQINGIRSRLEYQIAQKDKQIQILSLQLDEMHTALALSHQRELELGGYNLHSAELYNGINPLESRDEVGYRASCSSEYLRNPSNMKTTDGKSYMSPSFVSERTGASFGNHLTSDVYEPCHNASMATIMPENMDGHSMDQHRLSSSVVHRKLPPGSSVCKSRLEIGSMRNSTKSLSNRGGSKQEYQYNDLSGYIEVPGVLPSRVRGSSHLIKAEPRKSPLPATSRSHYVYPSMVSEKIISVGDYPFAGSDEAGRIMSSARRASGPQGTPRHLIHDEQSPSCMKGLFGNHLRTPGTTLLNTGASSKMAQRTHKAQAHAAFNHGPHILTTRVGAMADYANSRSGRNSGLYNSSCRMHSNYGNDAEIRIVSLERDLISTKVALADSETQRDIEITQLRRQTSK